MKFNKLKMMSKYVKLRTSGFPKIPKYGYKSASQKSNVLQWPYPTNSSTLYQPLWYRPIHSTIKGIT